ncbi:hypothetical protein EXIGLDRAFT_266349 [Exidia glandulosa HHB12029]|uniref:Uncharacterized protein n=1 Tax=Exidia glandulosa HHB12029 TaxID=1314781 RepID=A0A165MAG6_EXIGL|nr:hypothetical protein EXIGLDRAFT_266349 [Exidia glandulosa HHB12029]
MIPMYPTRVSGSRGVVSSGIRLCPRLSLCLEIVQAGVCWSTNHAHKPIATRMWNLSVHVSRSQRHPLARSSLSSRRQPGEAPRTRKATHRRQNTRSAGPLANRDFLRSLHSEGTSVCLSSQGAWACVCAAPATRAPWSTVEIPAYTAWA